MIHQDLARWSALPPLDQSLIQKKSISYQWSLIWGPGQLSGQQTKIMNPLDQPLAGHCFQINRKCILSFYRWSMCHWESLPEKYCSCFAKRSGMVASLSLPITHPPQFSFSPCQTSEDEWLWLNAVSRLCLVRWLWENSPCHRSQTCPRWDCL